MFSGHLCGIIPRHELTEAIVAMPGGEPGKRVGEPGLRIDTVQLGGLDEAGDDGPVLTAVIRAGEQRILAVQGNRPDRSFDRVAVEFDAAIVQEPGQSFPAGERRADRLGKTALAADLREPRVENAMEFINDGAAMLLARCATMMSSRGLTRRRPNAAASS